MRNSLLPLIAVWFPLGSLLAVQTLQADEPELEPGFVRLDNGRDLTGWTGRTEGWSVVDGAIHLDSKIARGSIFSEKKHSGNAILRMQFRATPRADSGVFIHGKQLQVRDYPTAGPRSYAEHARPAGQWNDLEFDITDGVAVVKLNGLVIEKAWPIGNRAEAGVGLQKEIGDFDFRCLRMMEKRE